MTDSLVLIGALAIAIERFVEPFSNYVKKTIFRDEGSDEKKAANALWRRVFALGFGTIIGLVIALVFELDVVSSMAGTSIDNGDVLTGLILGLGIGPVHEIVKYVEKKKNKAGQEAEDAATNTAVNKANAAGKIDTDS